MAQVDLRIAQLTGNSADDSYAVGAGTGVKVAVGGAGGIGVTVSGTPTSGEVLTATSATAADWQAPASGGGGGTLAIGSAVTGATHSALLATDANGDLVSGVASASVVAAAQATPGNLGANYALNLSGSRQQMVRGTLNANLTITVSPIAAGYLALFTLVQDTTGSRTLTVSDGTNSAPVAIPSSPGTTVQVLISSTDGTNVDVQVLGGLASGSSALPINSYTASFTFALTDAQALVEVNSASAVTATIPPNASVAFPVGTTIEVLAYGAGTVTIAAGAGVTLHSVASKVAIGNQYGTVSLTQLAANTWLLTGDLA
jgi:hypothetical protein